ncbi:MAG TPA: beta-propeller fold lactonase family protein [Gaiellaceae bacterium]|jgi:6-phosphogluconolactonase (cycloisomerase 2 family)
MRRITIVSALLAVAVALATATHAAAADGRGGWHEKKKVVFVQTNKVTGNRVVVYVRSADGTLTRTAAYGTGGKGGVAAPGTESDRLASQGSLVYDSERSLLLAVNAGSDTISAFRVRGDRLDLEDVVPSGGQFPASIAVSHRLVYVLNAGGAGILKGFRLEGHELRPLAHSTRTLGLANTNPPFFLNSPGQIGFTPDGRKLIATTKASSNEIDVFHVRDDGRLSRAPVANPSATPVPFAFTFTPHGRLVSGEAGASTVTTYKISRDGALTKPRSQSDGQTALCWITSAGHFYYVSNTGSDTLSSYRIGEGGAPILVESVAAHTSPGPIDLAASGRFLYAQTGTTGTVDEFRIGWDGSLTRIGTVTDLPPGIEGIAAS